MGPHAADDTACPLRPAVTRGVVQRLPTAQQKAIRKTQNQAYWNKSSDLYCGGRYSTPDTRQTSPLQHISSTASSAAPSMESNIAPSATPSTASSTAPTSSQSSDEEEY
jgi:hypothetical protein